MAITQIPSYSTLADAQFVQVLGPDQITTGYQFDKQQRALYFKESQVVYPTFHGASHIAEDPVPNASCDTPGLMSADDKCKLDAILQTRLGVLGFQGAGFPSDGGWMMGDIILAAGTEFISIERIGNVIRWTVDSPIPLQCTCEECNQIFWVQDETDVVAIRPPTCGGKLPGLNGYGELKVYLYPESTLVDPNDASASLNNKGNYPALIFKRYDDTITPGAAEYECILKRDSTNSLTTEIGWAFTPGATGVPELVYFMGKDDDGNLIRFDITPNSEPGLLGSILYKGHLITKKMGVVTNYTATILSTNQYTVKEWDVDTAEALGDAFTATNVWQYNNPENAKSGTNPQSLILDSSVDLIPIGTLVDLWAFKVGEISGEPILRRYFSKRPAFNPNNAWMWAGSLQFGDLITARAEVPPVGSEGKDSSELVSSIRNIERSLWGITGYDDPLVSFELAEIVGTNGSDLSTQHRAIIDTDLPGLVVTASGSAPDDFSERPVWIWNRKSSCNWLLRADIGRPDASAVPVDIALRAEIDENVNKYMRVVSTGVINGLYYVRVCGVNFLDLPPFGTIRVLSAENENLIFNYQKKLMFPVDSIEITGSTDVTAGTEFTVDCNSIVLIGSAASNVPYPGAAGDIVELLHQEYSCPLLRIEFTYDQSTGLVGVQFKVGTLDMSEPYEGDIADDVDDFVRGLATGYAVSALYTQAGTYTGIGTQPASSLDGFVVLEGGAQLGGDQSEYWNKLEVMLRDNQVWIWWNQLLIPPNDSLSGFTIGTPYFPITQNPVKRDGKVGLRLWPGSKVRRMDVRTQLSTYSEFTYGQLEIS